MANKTQTLEVDGQRITVSNLEKVLYPEGNVHKAQVIDFYIRIARFILPHLRDRPVTLKRYPNGVTGGHFYEKDAPRFTPDWVQTFLVPRRMGGKDIRYILINDLPTLVWLANLANLEIHPFLHRISDIQRPTHIVFDLDPGEGANLLTCAEVAFLLRDVLRRLKLKAFPKVSGSKGIQICVPLNAPVRYDATQPFAKTLAELLHRQHPDLVVSKMAKELRPGKVFIDWSQNSDYKTTISVYSLRAKHKRPFVSMPVRWEELDAALKSGKQHHLFFGPEDALKRLAKLGDLFQPVLSLRQNLPADLTSILPGEKKRRARSLVA